MAISFTLLGFLKGGTSSFATDISADGKVVIGYANSAIPSMATPFIWTAANGMQSLGAISGAEFAGSATAISADGRVVVGQSNDLAYRWSASTGKATLGSFSSGLSSIANDVCADGSVVVGEVTAPGSEPEAFRWTENTGMVGLGAASSANAVSADGSVLVGQKFPRAAIWTQVKGWTPIATEFLTEATAISADARVVVGQNNPPGTSSLGVFRWTQAQGTVLLGNLGQAGTPNTVPSGVSSNGGIFVGTEFDTTPSDSRKGPEAIVWDPIHGIRALRDVLSAEGVNLAEWADLTANAVSADGAIIAGWGTKPDGTQEAWVANIPAADIPPKPPTLLE